MSKLSSSNANIEFITTEYDNEVIECYSIGKSNIAVGLKNYINIYNLDGTFLYGIKFKSNSSYFLEYEGNDLYLYIHRSSECIKITGFEKPLLFYYINDTKYNNDYVLHKLNCVYNDFKDDSNVYKVKGINNTKLVRISEDNIQKVIYNSTSNVGLKIIVVVIGNIMFVFVISYNIIINKKQNKQIIMYQNAHGDVVNLTDKDGKVTKTYTYDAFGVEKNIDENDTNVFRYCGEYYDTETGTIYLRARYYNPSTGRFISRDSYAGKNEEPLSLNKYTYCQNNPLIFVDPSGKYSVVIWANYPNEDKSVTKDNKKQAKIIKEQYEEKYGSECYVYEVGTAEDFVNTWNSLDDSEPIDEIQFIGHGSVGKVENEPYYSNGFIYFGDNSRLYSSSSKNINDEVFNRARAVKGINDFTIDNINQKNVNSIYFSACNTANLDFNTNIANAFFKKNNTQKVTGWDGGVSFTFNSIRSLLTSFNYKVNKDGPSVNQKTFNKFKEKYGSDHEPGKVVYTSTGVIRSVTGGNY